MPDIEIIFCWKTCKIIGDLKKIWIEKSSENQNFIRRKRGAIFSLDISKKTGKYENSSN